MTKFFAAACLGLMLQGCETLGLATDEKADRIDEHAGWNVARFRTEAKKAMEAGNYEKAVKLYQSLEARFPFGEAAAQTLLDLAYAYYKNDDPESAVATAERFIKLNPRNPHIDYAYYLRGLVNFKRDIGFIGRYLPIDLSQRDQSSAREAYQNFAELIRLFPNSRYVADARLRMVALNNNMAMYEVHVARYYLERGAFVAAVNRSAKVVEQYQRTAAVPYALQVMEQAYAKLGMDKQAADVRRVYQLNFPDGPPPRPEVTLAQRLWDFIGFDD